MEQDNKIIIDIGSGNIKIGFSSDEKPRFIIPTVIGKLKFKDTSKSNEYNDKIWVGYQAQSKRGILNIKRPIENGSIMDWDAMISIFEYCFNELLKIDSKLHFVLITEPPFNSIENKEKMIDIMLNKFNVKGVYILNQALSSLYSVGTKDTGLVLQSGYDSTYSIPIYKSNILLNGQSRIFIGGRNVNNNLTYLLNNRLDDDTTTTTTSSINLSDITSTEIIRDIKEKCCFVSIDYNQELEKFKNNNNNNLKVSYELPIGDVIEINDEQFKCTEILFQTSFLGFEHYGIHETIYRSILKSIKDLDISDGEVIKNELFKNIILCGGNMMFKGMVERIKKELSSFASCNQIINVISMEDASYIGASYFSSLSSFESMCIKKIK